MSRSPRPVPEMPNSSPLTLASTAQRLNSDQHVRIPHPNRPTLLSPRRPNVTEVELRVGLLFFPAAFLNGQTNSYSGSHGVTPEVCVSVWFFSLSICITLQFVPRPAAFLGPAVPDGRTDRLLVHFCAALAGSTTSTTSLRASRAGLDPRPLLGDLVGEERRAAMKSTLFTNTNWRVLLRLRWLACYFIASITTNHRTKNVRFEESSNLIITQRSLRTFVVVKWPYEQLEISAEYGSVTLVSKYTQSTLLHSLQSTLRPRTYWWHSLDTKSMVLVHSPEWHQAVVPIQLTFAELRGASDTTSRRSAQLIETSSIHVHIEYLFVY